MSYSASGDTGTKPITPVDIKLDGDPRRTQRGGSGCEAADFAGFPAGNIALIQRGDLRLRGEGVERPGRGRRRA